MTSWPFLILQVSWCRCWSNLLQGITQMLDQILNLENLKDRSTLHTSCSPDHSQTICAVWQRTLSCLWGLMLSWRSIPGPQWYIGWWHMSSCCPCECQDSGLPSWTIPRASHSLGHFVFFSNWCHFFLRSMAHVTWPSSSCECAKWCDYSLWILSGCVRTEVYDSCNIIHNYEINKNP